MKSIKKKRKCIIVLVMILAASSLMGCVKGEQYSGVDWQAYSGETLRIALNQHPYAEAIISKLPEFEELTGIKVEYSITYETDYFSKLTTNLDSRTQSPDVFMIGPTKLWEYVPNDYIYPLDDLIKDASLTSPDYDIEDFFPNVLNTFRWDKKFGHKMGEGSLWSIPLGCEVYNLMYNKNLFKEHELNPPKTTDELLELCEKISGLEVDDTYALAVRGTREWATIMTSYISLYTMWGATDFEIEDGKLVSRVNSKEAVEMTEFWVKCIKAGGAKDWQTYTWYKAAADLGGRKAFMLYCADNMGWYQNILGGSEEHGNIAWTTSPLPPGKTEIYSHFWSWALSINNKSDLKEAAWLFIQYFTSKDYLLWAGVNAKQVDPVRQSVVNSLEYKKVLSQATGYEEAFNKTINSASILFTPQPHFTEVLVEWAGTIQDLVADKYESTQAGMDALKVRLDIIVSDVDVEQ